MDPDILINAVSNATALVKHSSLIPQPSFPRHHQLGCAIVICACFESPDIEVLASVFKKPASVTYETLFGAIKDPKSLESIRHDLVNGKYESAKSFYLDLKSVYSTLAVLHHISPHIWLAAQNMDSFIDDAWVTVVSLQAEKVENGDLENPLPGAHQLFENDPPNTRPLCLTDARIEDVLQSLSGRMTAEAREQLASEDRSARPPRLTLPTPHPLDLPTAVNSSEPDPDIEVVYPAASSVKRELTPDLFLQPPSPSSLDQLPSSKRIKLSDDCQDEQVGWLPNIHGINLLKASSLLLDLLRIILDHPRMIISDHRKKLRQCIQKPIEMLISTIIREEPPQCNSLTIIDQSIYSVILNVKRILRDELPKEEEEAGRKLERSNQKASSICLQRIYNEVYKFDFTNYCKVQAAKQTEEITSNDDKIHANHLNNFKRNLHGIIRAKVAIKLPTDSDYSPKFGDSSSNKLDISTHNNDNGNRREQDYQELIAAEQEETRLQREGEGIQGEAHAQEEEQILAKLQTEIRNSLIHPTNNPNPRFTRLTRLRFKAFPLKVGDWIRLFDPQNPSKPIIGQILDLNRLAPNLTKAQTSQTYVTVSRYLRSGDIPTSSQQQLFSKEVFRSASFQVHPIEDILDCCAVLHINDYLKGRPAEGAGIYTTHFCRYGYNPILQQLTSISEGEFQKMMPKGYKKPELVNLPTPLSQDELKVQKEKPQQKFRLKTIQAHFQNRAQSDPLTAAPPTDLTRSPNISHPRRLSEFNGLFSSHYTLKIPERTKLIHSLFVVTLSEMFLRSPRRRPGRLHSLAGS